MKLASQERAELERILSLSGAEFELWIGELEEILEGQRHLRMKVEQTRKALKRTYAGIRFHAGRPAALRDFDVLYLWLKYTKTTGRTPKRSRSDPFYRVCQICLHMADPEGLILRACPRSLEHASVRSAWRQAMLRFSETAVPPAVEPSR